MNRRRKAEPKPKAYGALPETVQSPEAVLAHQRRRFEARKARGNELLWRGRYLARTGWGRREKAQFSAESGRVPRAQLTAADRRQRRRLIEQAQRQHQRG